MDIDYAIIADYADIASGKLFLAGGGWDSYVLKEAPGMVRMAVAVGVRFGWEETNLPSPVLVTVEDDDGKTLMRLDTQLNVGRPPLLAPGSTQLAQMAANIQFNVERHGGYRVTIQAGQGAAEAKRILPFRIVPRV